MKYTHAIAARLSNLFLRKEYVGAAENRSESDTGYYVSFVNRANRDAEVFRRFKRHPTYRQILEHTTKEQADAYLEIVKRDSPDLLARVDDVKINDRVGSPYTCFFDGVGEISPSTLRYLKVASDLRLLFGEIRGRSIAEIGVGYGGQMLVIDALYGCAGYTLFDLPPVLQLTERYLESHILNSCYETKTINQSDGSKRYDLVISNYAFSELPARLQRTYISKILRQSARGYLTMNSGREGDTRFTDKLMMPELKELLPPFEVREEYPLTSPYNYVICWGHK